MINQFILSTLIACTLLNPVDRYDTIIRSDSSCVSTSLTSGIISDIYDSVKITESLEVTSGITKQLSSYTNINNCTSMQASVISTENDVVKESINDTNDADSITEETKETSVIQGEIKYYVYGRNFSEISEDEYNMLCQIVTAEAGTYQSREMVAEVILNRKEITGKSIIDIVYEKNQFEPVSDGRLWTVEVTQEIKDAVNDALSTVHHPKEMLFFRNNYYHELSTTIPYAAEGNTYFSLCYCY